MAESRPEMFDAEPPCFLKVIVEETLSERRLLLPKQFVRRHGKDLPNLVVLKVHTDDAGWEIGLTKSEGKVWLEEGWQEFAEHYSLLYGYYAVFEYEDNSDFNVLIFDRGATEIDYPPRNARAAQYCSFTSEINGGANNFADENRGGGTVLAAQRCQKPDQAVGESGPKSAVTVKGKARAVQTDNTSETKDPSFKIYMTRSYIQRYLLHLPYKFARRHFGGDVGRVILKVPDGKTWSVKYRIDAATYKKPIFAKFYGGWMEFVRDNHLKVGDVCVFKLVKGNVISLEVAISRSAKDYGRSAQSVGELRKPRLIIIGSSRPSVKVFKDLENFTSKYPSFHIVLRPTYMGHSGLYVPFKFAKTHMMDKGKKMTLQHADESWPVKYNSYPSRKICRITIGWLAFMKSNSLREGDGLSFELIKSDILKVTIFRNSD